MERLKRSLYIALAILIVVFLIKFMFNVAMYLLPIALIIYAVKKITTFIKSKINNKEEVDKINNFDSQIEINEEFEGFSTENAIEVEYEEVEYEEDIKR